ncbi:2-isopropylmalate synthase (Alpha-isopropylmalate synthase) (Alpha-IPM synthetase) [Dispira simplex]|nr:2-isopropylmalate synthase (Alpha-isopropylmalate synthase) (Alpha-IPM synthetase) [Dispira simplex]
MAPEPIGTLNESRRMIYFSDTTMRDGEQAPGVSFSSEQKLIIARQLSQMGIHTIEVGFPASSLQTFEICRRVAQDVGNSMEGRQHLGKPPVISVLCRTLESDIRRGYEAVQGARDIQLRLFIATSDIHLQHKLHITREECLRRVRDSVRFAKTLTPNIAFGAEDGSRTDPQFLLQVNQMAIDEGATSIFYADTVGSSVPGEIHDAVKYQITNLRNAENIMWGIHCHNDLGVGVANILAGIQAGADYVDCTITGVGERAGNAAAEEVAMCLTTHADYYNATHQLNTRMFTQLTHTVAQYGGFTLAENKPVVGANVFRHASGIHQDGILKNPLTYQYIDPELVGATGGQLVMGKHSGSSALLTKLATLGYKKLSKDEARILFAKYKLLAENRSVVTDADILELMKGYSKG